MRLAPVLIADRKISVSSQNELEAAVIELMASLLNTEMAAILHDQFATAEIVDREFTGVGFFARFKVTTADRLSRDIRHLGDTGPLHGSSGFSVSAQGPMFPEGGVGFILSVSDGKIVELEGHLWADGRWPADLHGVVVGYEQVHYGPSIARRSHLAL